MMHRALPPLVLATGLALAGLSHSAPVTGWVRFAGNLTFTAGTESTSSPSVTGLPADTIAAGIPDTLLSDGESILLTASVTFDGSAGGNQFRVGLFDGASPVVTDSGAGYSGINADAPSGTGGAVKFGNGSASNPFSSSASTTIGPMSSPGGAAPGNVPITFSLGLTRDGSALDIAVTLNNNAGWSSSAAIDDWTPPAGFSFRFNTVAFLMGGSMTATTAHYANLDVTVGDSDSDHDGLADSWELANGLIVGTDDSGLDPDQDGLTNLDEFLGRDGLAGTGDGTNPQSTDTDGDGLEDGVETMTGIFAGPDDTGTDPNDPDSDHDGTSDGAEVAGGYDPNDPADSPPNPRERFLLGIDFNRNDALGAPSQSRLRVIAGSTIQGENFSTYAKTIGSHVVTVSQPSGTRFEFRGANTDGSRAIPGGDTSLAFLVADFIATREGTLQLEITNLPAGRYSFRSYHLDSFTGSALGFAQGATTTTPNTIEARLGGTLRDSVQANALSAAGLNTTVIGDSQIPTIHFAFDHDGSPSLVVTLSSTASNGTDNFLLLNGFKLYQVTP